MKKYKLFAAVCLVTIAAIVYSCKTRRFETTKANYAAKRSAESDERGKVLVYSICAGCHYNRSVQKFIGNPIEDVPGIAGKVYAANLTHSKSHGVVSNYSDAEIKYLLKTGVARDGSFKSYMLRPNLSEADLNDIIAFLRSDDPSLAAADTTVGITHYTMIGKMFMNATAKPLAYKAGVVRPSDPAGLGYYLVDNIGCFHCHSKSLTKLNYSNPNQSKGYLAGGLKLKGEQGRTIRASNITPDKNTGIGNYTREQFSRAVKEGHAPDRTLQPPMPKFDKLSNKEVDAIYAYLQTVPPVAHKVKVL